MYTIHSVDAYIISVEPRLDSDAIMTCISDEYGLMKISIKSIRKEESKHRYIAQPYTFIKLSCISGKTGWRMTGIEEIDRIEKDSKILKSFINFGVLINKLVHGEENGILYSIFFDAWKENKNIDDIEAFERVVVLRILNSLGYIGESTITNPCLEDTNITSRILEHVRENIKPITTIINTSIRASGMS